MMAEQRAFQFYRRWHTQMLLSDAMAEKFRSELVQLFALFHVAGRGEGITDAIRIVGGAKQHET